MGLKRLREEAGLSQRELGVQLAKSVGSIEPRYAQPRICAYESGRNGIPLGIAAELVKILNKALKKNGSKEVATLEELAKRQKKTPGS